MTCKLVIGGTLTTLNEYIEIERSKFGHILANNLKRENQEYIYPYIVTQLKGIAFEKPVYMRYTWYLPDKRKDKDNIVFARKFIQDALVVKRIIPNDGWNDIIGFSDNFEVDRRNPRIEIEITDEARKC